MKLCLPVLREAVDVHSARPTAYAVRMHDNIVPMPIQQSSVANTRPVTCQDIRHSGSSARGKYKVVAGT